MRLGLLLLLVSALAGALISRDTLRYDDEIRYNDLAVSLVHKHGYVTWYGPTAWWPPGYPFAMSAAYAIDARPLSAKLMNAVLLTLAALVTARLAARLHPMADMLVPYMALAYPVLLYTAGTLYPQTLGSLLFVSVIALVSAPQFSMASAVAAGVLSGLLVLTIPSFMLTLPILSLYLILSGKAPYRRSLSRVATIAALTVCTMSPWIARNYAHFHALVPVSTNGGVNLLIGNSAYTRPNVKPDDSTSPEAAGGQVAKFLCPQAINPMDEVGYDHLLKACAIDWITRHKAAAAQLYIGKVLNYFNYQNRVSTALGLPDWKNVVLFISYYCLLTVALVRLAWVRRLPLKPLEQLIYLLYFANAFTSAIFFTRVRFRIPFDLTLIVIDAAFIAAAFDHYRAKLRTREPTVAR